MEMTRKNLIDCHNRIKPFIHNTPVLTSTQINKMTGSEIYFKCDNFQKMGAFKMRGATNAILQLSDENKKNGVVTHSSGNFAQALSLAAKSIGVKAYIVMPSSATEIKKTAVKGYGGELIECEPNLDAREKAANDIAKSTGAIFLHPSNDIEVILGQGTACKELLEYNNSIEHVLVPIGGGGLIAGSALAAKYFGKNCTVIGAEPFEVDDAYRSLKSGKIETNESANTIADGLKTQLGDKNFPIIRNEVKSIIRITEEEIIEGVRVFIDDTNSIGEGAVGVAVAGYLSEKDSWVGKKVAIIACGGNISRSVLKTIL